jgi:hypothetical protein
MVWYGMVRYGMVWDGMVLYGMVWYGMVWYGTVQVLPEYPKSVPGNPNDASDNYPPPLLLLSSRVGDLASSGIGIITDTRSVQYCINPGWTGPTGVS